MTTERQLKIEERENIVSDNRLRKARRIVVKAKAMGHTDPFKVWALDQTGRDALTELAGCKTPVSERTWKLVCTLLDRNNP